MLRVCHQVSNWNEFHIRVCDSAKLRGFKRGLQTYGKPRRHDVLKKRMYFPERSWLVILVISSIVETMMKDEREAMN
jgi:hypothetical protein